MKYLYLIKYFLTEFNNCKKIKLLSQINNDGDTINSIPLKAMKMKFTKLTQRNIIILITFALLVSCKGKEKKQTFKTNSLYDMSWILGKWQLVGKDRDTLNYLTFKLINDTCISGCYHNIWDYNENYDKIDSGLIFFKAQRIYLQSFSRRVDSIVWELKDVQNKKFKFIIDYNIWPKEVILSSNRFVCWHWLKKEIPLR